MPSSSPLSSASQQLAELLQSIGVAPPPSLPHDHGQFMRFLGRIALLPPDSEALAATPFDFAFYTDDKVKLAAAHRRQCEAFPARRAADPTYRLHSRVTFDPASRGHAKSRLTPGETWSKTLLDNRPGPAVGITLRINETDGTGVRNVNFVHARALFADVDTAEAVAGAGTFVQRTGLEPSLVVRSSVRNEGEPGELHKLHLYWLLNTASRLSLRLDRWSTVQRALAEACSSDASLDDPSQAMRVPGTLNLKDPARPSPVLLLYADGPDYDAEDFIARSRLVLKPAGRKRSSATTLRDVHGRPVKPPVAALAAALGLQRAPAAARIHNFSDGVVDTVDVRAAARVCPALAETFATGGATHSETLWFLMIALAVFDHDPPACAHAMSRGHPGYTPVETEAKLERARTTQRQQDLGWTSCQRIAQHHPACATCYYQTGTTGPLTIASKVTGVFP